MFNFSNTIVYVSKINYSMEKVEAWDIQILYVLLLDSKWLVLYVT